MAKKLFRITSYYLGEEMPTQYPVQLHVENGEASSFSKVNEIYEKSREDGAIIPGKTLFCMRVQEYNKDESGGLAHCDDRIRMGKHPYYRYGCYNEYGQFSYGDIVEVIDGDQLTLGIIIHKPWALTDRWRIVIMPQWYYKYTVLVYKADGTISQMELTETQMISGRGIVARPIVKALKEESRNICVLE